MSTTFLYALLSGVLPSLLWLWFWLREDNLHPEPRRLIIAAFLGGMLAVPVAIPIQKFLGTVYSDRTVQYMVWAATEEIVKFTLAYLVVLRSRFFDEPIDALIYMITIALGFAALENTFFILRPLGFGNVLQAITTGNLRFIGATLLHIVSSATIGVFIALPYYKGRLEKIFSLSTGILAAVILHTSFNLFIINTNGTDTIVVFGCVWLAVVLLMLLFEKVKLIQPPPGQTAGKV